MCTLFTGPTSKEGIFMRYSYEYKRKCVEMYRQGLYPETPAGVSHKVFHDKIRNWVRMEDACGPDALRHKNHNKTWTAEKQMKNIVTTVQLTESEREELIRLRAENEFIKAENEVIKKEIALREEKQAARLKAKKQRSLKNFVKKDTN